MCLSTVYKNTLTPETVMMKNVMRIECKDGVVILTDLMERQMAIEGTLEMANLVTSSMTGLRTSRHSMKTLHASSRLSIHVDTWL